MRSFICLTVSALAAVVAANSKANPFEISGNGYSFTVGEATTLKWRPTTSGSVSLRLQQGSVTTSTSGDAIASDIDNDGSYTWTVPDDVNTDWYTIEIISDEDSSNYNFLPRFTVTGATAAATPTAAATTSATSTTTSESTTTTSSSTSTSTSSTSSTSSSSSAATTMTTMTTSTTSTTSTETQTESTSTAASTSADSTTTSSSDSASSSTASASSSQTSVPATNGGLVNRVSGGMMAVVAGAIAFL
ncbi:hypothetical protein N7448_008235 [Penicillium atrosanguineum]|uniref:Yeast cell wall synthesis Kre9/Knh1-like N-terminal domain-containing protein n=1 Tax=Penicillium atrosanguineum TaxID=1132637 RepID=A0A9W9KXU2_9EURO|nr:hypothetical protein N7448_008235 [Penicillium atrosanguineum]KAJ5331038.1 hypothetical protein N7476_000821 [Penicillium atrosanguineum]